MMFTLMEVIILTLNQYFKKKMSSCPHIRSLTNFVSSIRGSNTHGGLFPFNISFQWRCC